MLFIWLAIPGYLKINLPVGSFYTAGVFLIVVGIVLNYLVSRLSYHYYRYELSEKGFKKESGIIWKRYVTIPYDRIQNVDISRGVFARLLGLSDIQIHTAGVGGVAMGEGWLPALSIQEAEIVRDEVLDRSRNSRLGQQGL